MSPKIVDKEAKKREIIQAAIQMFAQNGIAKTKMIDIAQTAKIGKGTIYEYFHSKDDIFGQAFQHFYKDMQTILEKAITATDDPIEKLRLLFNISFSEFLESSGDLAKIIMDFWAEGMRNKDEKILGIFNLKQIYAEYRFLISNILKEGIQKGVFKEVDTMSLAAILIAAMDGVTLQWIMEKDLLNIRQISNVLLDVLLDGIKK